MTVTEEAPNRAFGWRPSLPDPRDIIADASEIPVLPEVDPRGDYMPPVYDQGHLGSCTANAVRQPSTRTVWWTARGSSTRLALRSTSLSATSNISRPRAPIAVPWVGTASKPHASSACFPKVIGPTVTTSMTHASGRTLKPARSGTQITGFSMTPTRASGDPSTTSTGAVEQADDSVRLLGVPPVRVGRGAEHRDHQHARPFRHHSARGPRRAGGGLPEAVPQPLLVPELMGTDWGMDGYFLMPWSVLLDANFSGDSRTIYRPLQE